ncbi:MAG: hypothetical protein ACJA1U_000021 [Bermanella sp.]|jgi:uncharacterized protein (TIGR02001 family)
MKTLSKAVAMASLLSAGVMGAQVANAEVSFNAALVSDYVFRGFSFSDNGPALQGGADYSHDSGAYVGTWLSTTDDGEETGYEYDIYAGYWMETNGLEVDLGYTTYNYDEGGYDTAEIYANVTKGAVTASIYRDIDAYETTYLAAVYSMELPQDLALDLGAGYLLDGEDEDGADVFGDDVIDLSATVSKSLEMVDVAFTVTHIEYDFAEDDNLFFLSVSKEF